MRHRIKRARNRSAQQDGSGTLQRLSARDWPKMKRDSVLAVGASALIWLMAFPTVAVDKGSDKTDFAIFAICRVEQHVEVPGGSRRITIESGMGDGGFPVATTSRSAQQWFNYGITLFHAFYHDDVKLAFDKSVAADPGCAMCLWGQALSRGPTANYDVSDEDLKSGLGVARKSLAAARTERERLLATAMVRRYSRAQDVAAERDFAADLLKAEAKGPDTPDLRLLAAEVLLTAFRRGDNGAPTDAMSLIEPILRQRPEYTAAIHYYIHATEFAGRPALALTYAEKLATLAPKASHLVHMPSHTFLHVGRYEDAAAINAIALKVDAEHLTDTATPGPPSVAIYYGHNLRFGMASALMSGDHALALKFADDVHRAYPERDFVRDEMSDAEGQRFVIYARYDPTKMLSLPEPSPDNPRTRSLYHYARAEAFAALHDAAGLSREATQVTGADPVVTVAKAVLAGRFAMLQGHFAEAAQVFEAAAAQQDTLLASSMDPPRWWYPVRRSAAAAWLMDGQLARAAEAAKVSLQSWPNDPLALLVLSRAENELGRTTEARHDDAKAIGNWEGDIAKVDITII
jgi:tetratricopeptide (TPR) repeat protein